MQENEQDFGDFTVADDGSVGLNVFAKTKNKKNYGKETYNLAERLQGASVQWQSFWTSVAIAKM